MTSILNLTALNDAMESGMSSATIHNWVDDAIEALLHHKENKSPHENYIVTTKSELEEVKDEVTEMCRRYMRLAYGAGKFAPKYSE